MSGPSYVFSRDPAWMQTTRSGFRQQELAIIISNQRKLEINPTLNSSNNFTLQRNFKLFSEDDPLVKLRLIIVDQVFVMYHATKTPESAAKIIQEGFDISQGGPAGNPNLFLGDGLYVSRDIHKTQLYGTVCFKLLVYPGKTFVVEENTSKEERISWQGEFSSAWIPPNNKIHPTGLEETCVKSPSQVRVLGIAYGYELLDFNTQSMIKNQFGTADHLDPDENRTLDAMLEQLGIIYSNFVHLGSQLLLESTGGGSVGLRDWSGLDRQLWSRTWDNCLENKETGEVLTFSSQDQLPSLRPVNVIGDKSQKWRLDGQSRFQHKQSNLFLSVVKTNKQVIMMGYNQGGDRENWMFRCMDQSRKTDSYVNFTPWQSMTSW